jgi:hypothetical protein
MHHSPIPKSRAGARIHDLGPAMTVAELAFGASR